MRSSYEILRDSIWTRASENIFTLKTACIKARNRFFSLFKCSHVSEIWTFVQRKGLVHWKGHMTWLLPPHRPTLWRKWSSIFCKISESLDKPLDGSWQYRLPSERILVTLTFVYSASTWNSKILTRKGTHTHKVSTFVSAVLCPSKTSVVKDF